MLTAFGPPGHALEMADQLGLPAVLGRLVNLSLLLNTLLRVRGPTGCERLPLPQL